jgi:hypothetical protein
MESALIVLLDKIPSWVIWFIPIAWLAPKFFGLRIIRKTHGGVKFTTPIKFKMLLNLREWSLLPPFMPSDTATVIPISPGICLYNKLLSDIEIYPTARQTTNLQYQALVTNDKHSIAVSTIIAYEVTDLVRAFGETWDVEDLIKDISLARVRLLLTAMSFAEIIEDQASIDESLTKVIKADLEKYGIQVIKAYFTDLAPSSNTLFMGANGSSLLPTPINEENRNAS